MDASAIDFDTLFEDVSPEHIELLKSSLEESSRKFGLFTQVCLSVIDLLMFSSLLIWIPAWNYRTHRQAQQTSVQVHNDLLVPA